MTKYYIGKTFTANPAGVVSNPKSTTAYQWLSESLPITGETSSTYATSITDENKQLQVRQIETNRFGFDSAVSSAVEVNTSSYGITDTEPYILCDFLNDYYRKDYADSTFDSVCDYSTTTLNTMFDSTGTLVWAPHNLLTYSEDLTGWDNNGPAIVSEATVEDDDAGGHEFIRSNTVSPLGGQQTLRFQITKDAVSSTTRVPLIRADGSSGFDVCIDTSTGDYGDPTGNTDSISVIDRGDYFDVEVVFSSSANFEVRIYPAIAAVADVTSITNGDFDTSTTGSIEITKLHVYRSDLGGMADNPDQTVSGLEKYVPTTSAAVYLPRRNAYYYNGTAWVNGGLLLESSAVTNLVHYSRDLTDAWWDNAFGGTVSGPDASGWVSLSGSGSSEGGVGTTAITYVDLDPYTFSFEVEKGSGWLLVGVGPNNADKAWIDVGNGVKGASSVLDVRIHDRGDRWFVECINTGTAGSADILYIAEVSGDGVSNGSGSTTIKIRDVQLEQNVLASTHIPSAGSSATRAAQTLAIDYSDIIDIGGVKMQGQVSFTDQDTPTQHTFWRRYKDGNEYISVTMDTDSSTNAELNFIQSNGGNVGAVVLSTEYAPGILTHYNFSSSHGTNTINGNDGTDTGTADTTSDTLPTFTTQDLDIGYDYSGNISAFAIFENTLSDSLLGEASVDYNFWLYGDNINTTGLWVDSTGWD